MQHSKDKGIYNKQILKSSLHFSSLEFLKNAFLLKVLY